MTATAISILGGHWKVGRAHPPVASFASRLQPGLLKGEPPAAVTLPAGLQPVLLAALQADNETYKPVRPVDVAAHRPAAPDTVVASNPAQHFDVGFDSRGVEVRPRRAAHAGETRAAGAHTVLRGLPPVRFVVERFNSHTLHAGAWQIDAGRVTRHDPATGLSEWYVNAPLGLEQGFTLERPPSNADPGAPVTITMAIEGGWRAVSQRDGQAVTLDAPEQHLQLQYGHLAAWDASGRALVAALRVQSSAPHEAAASRLMLVVDTAGATYPITVDPLVQQAMLAAGDGAAGDLFGVSVALSGDTALVGAFEDDTGANANHGSAYVFTRSGAIWTQQAKLTANDIRFPDTFGVSVALSGDTALVGAGTASDGAVLAHGAAYVFTRTGTTWTQQQKLTAVDRAAVDFFGSSVALSGDTALVGSFGDDVGANGNQGSAYVFTRTGTTWTQQAKLTASDGAADDLFGVSVALGGDTAFVGAILDDVGENLDQGSAYVFTRSGATWTQRQKLTASDLLSFAQFGRSVALSGDTALVGAFKDFVGENFNQGSAYVFTRSGTAWTQQQKLTASDGAEDDNFGYSVALSGDTALVGAFFDDVGANASQGSAYVYTRSGTTWTQQQKITAGDGATGDNFGSTVALTSDTALVGAFKDNVGANADQGSAYVFTGFAPATPPVGTTMTLNRTTAQYGGIISGSTVIGTSAQTFTLNQSGAGTVTWTAAPSQPWLTVTPTTGTGTSSFTVAINSTGLPASGTVTGTVTITAPAASNSPQILTVTVVVHPSTASTSAPFGSWDTPTANATGIAGSLAVTGWALDDTEVSGIRIFRASFGAEPAGQQIFLGDALFVTGARPDVETANPTLPFNYRGGWGYQLLTNMLPGGGNGTFTLFVYADDREGKTTLLGTRTVTIANSASTKPFGAIDAPAPGATISGTAFAHYGWALTPNPKMIPLDGSTITVFIDGVLVGPVTYNQPRGDIAGLFPGLANTNGSLGTRTINTTTFANGVHTISWNVFDNAGIGEGIGSRYFAIQNGSSVVAGALTAAPPSLGSLRALQATHMPDGARLSYARIRVARGYQEEAPAEVVSADARGVRQIVAREQDRLVLQLWDQHPGDGTFAGYLAVGDELRPLPIGSTLDERAGVFSWAPGPGFLGRYDLVFVRTDRDGWREQIPVRVTLGPRY